MAAQGLTRRRYSASWRNEVDYVRAKIKPVAEIWVRRDAVPELKQELTGDLVAVPIDVPDMRGTEVFHVARVENLDKAIDLHEERMNEEEGEWTPEFSEKIGKRFGYPQKAIAEFNMRAQIAKGYKPFQRETDRARQEQYEYMQQGKLRAVEEGVPHKDLDYLEFVPSSDVEETKRAIAVRKAATTRERLR